MEVGQERVSIVNKKGQVGAYDVHYMLGNAIMETLILHLVYANEN